MKTFNNLTAIANKQRHPNRPITGWNAIQCGKVIDFNNSVALLRYKYAGVQGVTYKAIRS